MVGDSTIQYLNFHLKEYRGITQLIRATKQRLQSLPGEDRPEEFDALLKGRQAVGEREIGLEMIKARCVREIEHELSAWDIWGHWAKKIPGIGPWIAGELIILFKYRFIATCKACGGDLEKKEKTLVCVLCGKKAKKDGALIYRIEEKDFPTISKWWAYMGRHTVDGVMPKLRESVKSSWSTNGRTVGWHIGEEFNRQSGDNPYKLLLLLRKEKHAKNHPEWSIGHIHSAAKNEVAKIFLAHWWTVARTLDGKSVSEPYAGALMGHTGIINPYYWEEESETLIETHHQFASENLIETHDQDASEKGYEIQTRTASDNAVISGRRFGAPLDE